MQWPKSVSSDTTFTFTLVVNDGILDSQPDQVEISVLKPSKLIFAESRPDQYVYERTAVALDGSASYSSIGGKLTYNWTAPKEVFLSSNSDVQPTFIAPEVSSPTTYAFSLVVSDGTQISFKDQVRVTILDMIRVYPNITTSYRHCFKFHICYSRNRVN